MEEEVSFRRLERGKDHATFEVEVGSGRSATKHRVHVADTDLARYAPGARAEELVAFAFGFLLEREPKEAIMRDFGVSVIEEYFPEFPEHAAKEFGAR